jgi:U4/U6.U5 tri-snRNP-associated protein 2
MTKRRREEGDELAPRKTARIICPFLDTINRPILDFDFEKVCSVTLSNVNVYACLVCGKYFQGRGENTPAIFHGHQTEHHIFMNLETLKAYCLPEGYEIIDQSLDDIRVFYLIKNCILLFRK